jgi:hypothetical protein
MSTGLDCRFVHLTKGWYYFLERWSSREDYTAWGPFASFTIAHTHLHDHHANPGGFSSESENSPAREPRGWEIELIKDARR